MPPTFKTYSIFTLQDIADLPADPELRERFRLDFMKWLKASQRSAKMREQAIAAGAIRADFKVTRFDWTDDGINEATDNLKAVISVKGERRPRSIMNFWRRD